MGKTMNNAFKLSVVALSLALAACGSSSSDSTPEVVEPEVPTTPTEPEVVQGEIWGPFNTGTSSEPVRVYWDLDTDSAVELTAEEAATDTTWDIAFERYRLYLNANNADAPVAAYNLNNNAEFYTEDGINAELLTAATAESEEQEYLDVTTADIPADAEMFHSDVTEKILDGWYNYDFATHAVSAKPESYFVTLNGETYSKFNVTNITQDGFVATDMTLSVSYDFAEATDVVVDGAAACTDGATHAYVDFATASVVASDAMYDLMIPCATGGLDFDMDLAEGVTATNDFDNAITDADTAAIYSSYGYFKENEFTELGFAAIAKGSFSSSFVYGANGGHLLWSDFNVYIIKTADKHFKLQFVSYYNEEGTSGQISFRADEVLAAE